jgi:transcription antitermination factor NusG
MNSLAEQEKRVAIEAMIKAEGEHIRSQFIETVSPIEEVFSQVRNQMAEVCIEAAESFSKNGHLRGKTAEKLRGLVDFYNLIKIEDDANLLQKLQELKSVIGEVGSDRPKTATRPPQDVINALNGVIDLQKTIKADLIAGPSRVSMIG